MSRRLASLLGALLALAVVAAGCGSGDDEGGAAPQLILEQAGRDDDADADSPPTFPSTATANTIRVAGDDAVEDAAGVASAVFPATRPRTRPDAVVLVDDGDWQAGVAAAVLAGGEIGAPLLLSDGDELPAVTLGTLERLDPSGSELAGGAQVIAIGEEVPDPEQRRVERLTGADPFELAAEIDRFSAAAEGEPSDDVMIVSADDPAYAMPAAALAARSGDAVLFTEADAVPEATRAALEDHERPDIFVIGPESVVSSDVEQELDELGRRVRRVEGATPVENAIELARYRKASFGWGLVNPGHNFTLASTSRPLDAAAAAALATNGIFAPLLVTDESGDLPKPLRSYLLDVQPGYQGNPARGVFNRVWILGDQSAVSVAVQARIDELTELIPVQIRGEDEEPPDIPDGRLDRGRGGGGGGGAQDVPDQAPGPGQDDLDGGGPGGIPPPQGPGLPGSGV